MSTQRPEFGSYYEGFWGGTAFRWIDAQKVRLLRRVASAHPGMRLALDLGCGAAAISGHLTSVLHVIGVDHQPSLLLGAQARGIHGVRADFDLHLPFQDASFDLVLMADTIEHLENPRDALLEVLRLLKPEGVFVVFTPPYDSVAWVLAEKVHHLLTRRAADHISPFTREALTHLLRRHFGEWRVGITNAGLTLYGIATRPGLR